MNRGFAPILALVIVALVLFSGAFALRGTEDDSLAAAGKAFDEYGYNEKARIFNGLADGVDRNLDGKVWGDTTYAKDRLVMKWNEAWDACNDAGYDNPDICAGAWTDNEWVGTIPGGSGETWHYKIVWVGSAGAESEYWKEGGYLVWNNYEVLMDQGVVRDEGPVHTVYAKSTPNGYGAK